VATDKTVVSEGESHQLSLENTPGGIRMLRFFHWRELPLEFPLESTACQREEHALWACRAVAVGCGKPLTELRDCFDQLGPDQVLLSSRSNTGQATTCYNDKSEEMSKRKSKVPCHDYQQAVGECVATNLYELQQRVEQRKEVSAPPQAQ
jgi:hypothetical protein